MVAFAAYWIQGGNPIAINLSWNELLPDFSSPSSFVLLSGMLLALCGLEANANLASDMEDPKKNYPKAVFIGAVSTLAILVLGSLAIAIVIPKEEISLVSGLIRAFSLFFEKYNLSWMTGIIVAMTIAGSLGELNAWMFAGTKGLFISTQNDCLPKIFKKTNSRDVPTNLMLFQAIVVTLFTFVFVYVDSADLAYWILSALSVQMYLVMYICLFIAGPVLRIKEPKAQRLYSVPGKLVGMCILSTLGILSCLFALGISFLPPQAVASFSSMKGNFNYTALLLLAFAVNCCIPFGMYYSHKKLIK